MHLSGTCLLQNENLKLPKQRKAVFESLACLKHDKNSILMLLTFQNSYRMQKL